MNQDTTQPSEGKNWPFQVKDCSLIGISTGFRAQNLREFRDAILNVPAGSVYHHFWGRFLEPHFDEPEYNNDFAAWAYHGLHEKSLAERLAVVNPTNHPDMESLRREVVDIVEERLDEQEFVPWARADDLFYFIRSQLLVFDTGRCLSSPEDLPEAVVAMSPGSIFYHFIDARRRTDDRIDDFSAWLVGFGDRYTELVKKLATIDPYFSSLKELKETLVLTFSAYFGGTA